MKLNIKNIFSAVAAAAMLTACVGDLNTVPLNPTDVTSETAYGADEAGYLQGLTKIYFQLVSNNTQDLQVADGGASEFIRAFWSTQEVTADAAKCAWGDAWVNDLNNCTWKGDVLNDAVYAVYVRTLQGITYVNEYLRQTSDANLDLRGVPAEVKAKVQEFRAEARFLRAYFYWAAMDTFGQVPFSTEDTQFGGGYNPPQTPRTEIFNYVVSELEDLASDDSKMPAAQSNYPRADKGSVLGLLARVYLNAEVYTGEAKWAEAKATCEKIYGLGYALAPTHAELFRGDNGENPDARKEMLFAAAYDAENTQSYGGTTYLTLSTLSGDDGAVAIIGINGGWAGNRVPDHFVQKYFEPVSADFATGNYNITDKRAYFYIKGRTQSMEGQLNTFLNGWSCIKFNNVPHDSTAVQYAATAATKNFSDIDWPLIRLGEIHLIYAEACMHAGGNASAQLKALADRAGVAAPTTVDEDFLMAERARELMWEGHRRTDLIRYGKWIKGYNWTYKGGDYAGRDLPAHFNIFPVPSTELATNLELKQNPGY
ncbi:MAG: RagB/SusD family nutrient uptake outer membrane protein [Bacteroidales bacterium]|nr:RagB/SusD family nutrient uptake outer membrane protein [Bacteroidales bacterium]MBP3662978.1 RagB/SusD family nutrient uptake outer membrane protein [Bacteroidales bacterium]